MKTETPTSINVSEIETLSRKAAKLNTIGFRIIIFAFVLTALLYLFMYLGDNADTYMYSLDSPGVLISLAVVSVGLVGGGLIVLSGSYKKKLDSYISNHFAQDILANFFTVDTYEKFEHIDKPTVKETKLIDGWNKLRGTDYVKGRYKSVRMRMSDLQLVKVVHSHDEGTTSREVTVFKGQWIICEFHNDVSVDFVIKEKGVPADYNRNAFGADSLAFNARYDIETRDAESASQILTPQYMNSIHEASDILGGNLRLRFHDGRVHIALNSGLDLFEVSNNESELTELTALSNRFYNELERIATVLDLLTNNEQLFGA